MLGVLIGVMLFGMMADKYGRRKISLLGLVVMSMFGMLSALTQSYLQFVTMRLVSSQESVRFTLRAGHLGTTMPASGLDGYTLDTIKREDENLDD